MSTRSRKSKTGSSVSQQSSTTTTKVTSTSSSSATGTGEAQAPSTPQASTSFSSPRSSTPGRMRPPSPTVISRAQEKHELASLNDRLASYIDKVRSLETENARLTRQVQTHEETVTREVSGIKHLYEGELADARKLLDETAKQKARLKLENDHLGTENKDLKDRNNQLERELETIKRLKLSAEAQISDLQARLNDAVNQRKHWEMEYNKVRKELDDLKKLYAELQKQHEDETVQRVDLQNRLQSLREELQFKDSIHSKEVEEMKVRTRVEIEEVDGRMHDEYESRLREALQEMREENDAKIEQAREDTEAMYASKLSHLKDVMGKEGKSAEALRNELRSVRKRCEELSSQVTSLSSQNAGYLSRIADLERRLAREEEEHSGRVAALNNEIQRLREALEDQLLEYRDLMDVKIQLDNEIASYRRMLESEETRLNISQVDESMSGRSARRTPVRGSAVAKKRKRNTDLGASYLQSASSSGYTQKSSAKGAIEVYETDTDGKYIKLYNNSDKDQSLGSWQLKHTAGEQDTTFKFHRNASVKAKTYVTVWSSDSNETHNPPSDLVMKGQRWFTGDAMTTELVDPQGEEQATRELTKSQLRTTFSSHYGSGGSASSSDVEALEGDPHEKCAIM